MQVQTLESLAKQGALAGKRVLIRSDLNVPRDEAGNITDETRLIASVPAIRLALDAGAAVMVMSHLGRPTEGECRPEDSLAGITVRMSELVGVPITLSRRYLEEGVQIKPGQVVMLENCRCNKGEKKNNEELAKAYAALCDVYVNDAFGTAHRAQASTEGVARFASVACAGPLMASEIEALTKAVAQAEHPLVAIVGGSKVSTKLTILNNLAQKVDQLIVGGGIANTFLLAAGYKVGKSLAEPELVDECKKVLETLKAKGATLPLPVDVVAAKNFSPEGPYRTCAVEDVADDEMILDVGPKTAQILADYVSKAKTIVWNGPVGVFEMAPYAQGTAELAKAIAQDLRRRLLDCGRRRYGFCRFRFRCGRQGELYLHRRRCVPGIPGRQESAGDCCTAAARCQVRRSCCRSKRKAPVLQRNRCLFQWSKLKQNRLGSFHLVLTAQLVGKDVNVFPADSHNHGTHGSGDDAQ